MYACGSAAWYPQATPHELPPLHHNCGRGARTPHLVRRSTSAHRDIYSGAAEASYSFMGNDPSARQNQWLKDAAERQVPIIYFLGIKPGLYAPMFPAFVTDWNPKTLSVRIAFSPMLGSSASIKFPADVPERRYAMRLVKQRLDQCQFREAVIDAYAGRCAISKPPEPRLLDAAHIIRDADEELGHPIVPNGIPLSNHCRQPDPVAESRRGLSRSRTARSSLPVVQARGVTAPGRCSLPPPSGPRNTCARHARRSRRSRGNS